MVQDYRISLEELDRIRKSCVISARNFQEFIDHEKSRGERVRDLAQFVPFVEGFGQDSVIPAGALKGKRIITIACSVPAPIDFERGDRAVCHVIYLKDDGSCGETPGRAEDLLPEKYKWLGEPL